MIQVLENHQRYLSSRKHILDYPGEVERHMDARASLQDVAGDQQIELTGVPAYPDWRQEAERLTAAGEAILSGKETYGAHLDRLVEARTHMIGALSALREVIGVDDKELAERKARELRRQRFRPPGPVPGSHRMTALRRTRRGPCLQWRRACTRRHSPGFGRAIGHLVGGQRLPRSDADRDLRAGGPGALRGN